MSKKPYAILERTIYLPDRKQNVPLLMALKIMTDDWIDAGNVSYKTTIDLRDALIEVVEKL